MINFVWKSFPRSTSMYLVEMSHGNSVIEISVRASNYFYVTKYATNSHIKNILKSKTLRPSLERIRWISTKMNLMISP